MPYVIHAGGFVAVASGLTVKVDAPHIVRGVENGDSVVTSYKLTAKIDLITGATVVHATTTMSVMDPADRAKLVTLDDANVTAEVAGRIADLLADYDPEDGAIDLDSLISAAVRLVTEEVAA